MLTIQAVATTPSAPRPTGLPVCLRQCCMQGTTVWIIHATSDCR
jgi:hypothetical protein